MAYTEIKIGDVLTAELDERNFGQVSINGQRVSARKIVLTLEPCLPAKIEVTYSGKPPKKLANLHDYESTP